MSFSLDLGGLIGGLFQAGSGIASAAMASNSAAMANKLGAETARYLQSDAQDFNADQSEIQRKYNALEAQKSRDFVSNLSNTAYQRSVTDLRKAGLNPLLAVGSMGASTPSSATATGSSASSVGGSFSPHVADTSGIREVGSGLSNAVKSLTGLKLDLAKAEVEKVKQDTKTSEQMGDAAELKSKADAIDKAVSHVSNIGTAAASAYAVKKSTDLAKSLVAKGLTKESAKRIAKEVTSHSPRPFSASQSSNFLGILGKTLLPLGALGFGVSNDVKTSKRMSSSDFKDWSNLRASSYGY